MTTDLTQRTALLVSALESCIAELGNHCSGRAGGCFASNPTCGACTAKAEAKTALDVRAAETHDIIAFTCRCGASHKRGPIDGGTVYRCLRCGNTTDISREGAAEFPDIVELEYGRRAALRGLARRWDERWQENPNASAEAQAAALALTEALDMLVIAEDCLESVRVHKRSGGGAGALAAKVVETLAYLRVGRVPDPTDGGCPACNGSGETPYVGGSCSSCNGRGVAP